MDNRNGKDSSAAADYYKNFKCAKRTSVRSFYKPVAYKNWWGPNGFTNTINIMEVKPGGVWDLVMHGPDGNDYKNKSIFKEIVKPGGIVYDHVSAPKFTATITFVPDGNKTLLSWWMLFETAEEFHQVVKVFKADEGLKQNIERLAAYLQNTKI